ncbi:pentapeptide repeat-containing protein [Paraburkholderia sp. BR10923]|uniref:Pentapeptide repeat-containing protein n=1 Tax=Paraburkholderia youngii TaxID=2782701 RepID=A0A7Y6K392_9BURK|nr:pentapeptide repeat-containing protein [Paraburkholderia youngii]NUY02678.1 pentapeptide repeat-containing protein [Paraburkholderia youngii]
MIRKTLRKPSARKPTRRKQKWLAFPRDFHFWVDVTTLLASLATVGTLALLVRDRANLQNIAAWTQLQGYFQSGKRSQFNQGQGFAMQTLASNGVTLAYIEADGVRIISADLDGADFTGAQLRGAQFDTPSLSGAHFTGAVLRDAFIDHCKDCGHVHFEAAQLSNARIRGGDLSDADFTRADISGLEFEDVKLDEFAIGAACYTKYNPPKFTHREGGIERKDYVPTGVIMPLAPQSELCMLQWGKAWGKEYVVPDWPPK